MSDSAPSSTPAETPRKGKGSSSSLSIARVVASSDQISTPEKPTQLPWWRSRVAYSVKEVKQVALGLQNPQWDSTDRRSELDGSGGGGDGELLAVEQQLKSGSSSSDGQSSKRRPQIKLPDKYEILVGFFNSMECSIRLLRLKRLLPTFANISSSVEHLTGRRFTYGHLAQLKYILPEAISIKKVLQLDEATSCMKPELQIYLQIEMMEKSLKQKEESAYSLLRRVFRQRLVNFAREHPEEDDIPEETLPHPFDHRKMPNVLSLAARESACSVPVNPTAETEQFVPFVSHVPRSFKRRFSQRTPIPDSEKTSLDCLNDESDEPPKDHSDLPIVSSPVKCASRLISCKKPLFASPDPKSSMNTSSSWKDDIVLMNAERPSPEKLNSFDRTPAKLVSTPVRLMSATPEIHTSKRQRLATAYETPVKESEKLSARRTKLFPTPQKSAHEEDSEHMTASISDDDDDDDYDDVLRILPKALLQEVKEKERKAEKERGAGVAEARRRKEIIASLPKLFDMISLIFQSGSRSIITKQELVHKIISGSMSIVDKGEVEQQLKLLEELAPDWISAKMVSTGDFLYSVSEIPKPDEIRQRLSEAKG